MYHLFDFGPLSGVVQEYADANGFIPDGQSHWHNFRWPHARSRHFADHETGEANWQLFLQQASTTIAIAFEALENLREPKSISR